MSQARQFATANKSVGGHGPMGTSAGAGARKLAEETETFKVQKTGLAFGKALMQARMAKKMSQKFLLPVSDNSYKLIPSIRVDEYIG